MLWFDRRAFSLTEMMVAIALVGILILIAMPKGHQLFVKSSVRAARGAVFNTAQQARAVAISQSRRATVNLENGTGRVFVTASPRRGAACGGCTMDTVGAVTSLAAQHGVALNADAASFTFDNRGLGTNPNLITIEVRRENERDTVWVRGFGRVEK
ncbi:MAG: pilus assembly FimT family protein [Gemmatimonadales bacterium]